MEILPTTLLEAAAAVASVGSCASDIAALTDDRLIAAQRSVAALQRPVDSYAALLAGEIARRSSFELGYSGLAQRGGFRNAESLIQSVTHGTRAEAVKFVQLGKMMAEAEAAEAAAAAAAGSGDPETDGPGAGADATGPDATEPDATGRDGTGPDATGPKPVGPITEPPPTVGPDAAWRAPIAAAVSAGLVSSDQASAIRRGLGVVDDAVTADQLRAAATMLLTEAPTVDADQLFRHARRLREQVDARAIERREKEQHDLRYLRSWRRADGMREGHFLLDPEDGQLFQEIFANILSPRRGGPRFTNPDDKARADKLRDDPRTNDQISVDSLMQLLRTAIDADFATVLGSREPAVRIVVTADALPPVTPIADTSIAYTPLADTPIADTQLQKPGAGAGFGARASSGTGTGTGTGTGAGFGTGASFGAEASFGAGAVTGGKAGAPAGTPSTSSTARDWAPPYGSLEGHPDPVSIATVERYICDKPVVELNLDVEGTIVSVGRTHRLHTKKERIALGVRWGGCAVDTCPVAPSMCEAHHIVLWSEGGETTIIDGILLCRHHHMLVHNNHWKIVRRGNDYWLVPPREVDPEQTPVRLRSKTGLVDDLEQRREQYRVRQRDRQSEKDARQRELATDHERDRELAQGREQVQQRELAAEQVRTGDDSRGEDSRAENSSRSSP